MIWIFPFCLLNQISLLSSVLGIVYLYIYTHTHHNQYDIKSTFELILYPVKGPDFLGLGKGF